MGPLSSKEADDSMDEGGKATQNAKAEYTHVNKQSLPGEAHRIQPTVYTSNLVMLIAWHFIQH